VEEVCALLSGLVVSCDYANGKELVKERDFSAYKSFFRHVFEIMRRYKIMNPEKMRSSYGKMLYFLQDAASDEMTELLGFSVVSPVKTVFSLLEKAKALALLDDPALGPASMEVLAPKGTPRHEIDRLLRRKVRVLRPLKARHLLFLCGSGFQKNRPPFPPVTVARHVRATTCVRS